MGHLIVTRLFWAIAGAIVVFSSSVLAQEAPTMLEDFLDPGLAAVYEAGEITPLDVRASVDGYTVILDWAYADANRLAVAYRVVGQPDVEYTRLSSLPEITVTEADGTPVIGGVGMTLGGLLDPETKASFGLSIGAFEAEPGTTLDVRLDMAVESATSEANTTAVDASPPDAAVERTEPVTLTFTIPVSGTLRQNVETQTALNGDIAITLEAFRVSPTQIRLTVCFEEPEADRTWTSIPFVLVGGDELVPNGGTVNYPAGEREAAYRSPAQGEVSAPPEATVDPTLPARTCDDHRYIAVTDPYADIHNWTVEVRELVGFGSSGGDQHRIAGRWTFTVELP